MRLGKARSWKLQMRAGYRLLVLEQVRLRRLAFRFGKAEMPEGVRGEQASPRRALHKSLLDEIGFDVSSMVGGTTCSATFGPSRNATGKSFLRIAEIRRSRKTRTRFPIHVRPRNAVEARRRSLGASPLGCAHRSSYPLGT